MTKSKSRNSGKREATSSPSPSIQPGGVSQEPVSPPKPQDGPSTTVVAAQRPCPQPLHMSDNKINTMRTVDIPPYDGTESFTVWLRRAKFYLREVSEADRPWTLLKALAPKQLDKALDARLDADLPFDMLCQRLANLFSHTHSFGDAMEQLQQRRLKQDETLNQLVEDLERLTTVAFPSLGSADKDNTVLYYFIKALPTSDLSRSLLLQPPENVQEAVTRAERYLRLCPPTSRPLPPEDAHVRDAHPTSAGRGTFYPPQRFRGQTRPPFNRRGVPFRRPGGQMSPNNHICNCQRTTGMVSITSCTSPTSSVTPFHATVNVAGQTVRALIDTGATVSLVNPRVLPPGIHRQRNDIPHPGKLTTADGSRLLHHGTVPLTVTLPYFTAEHSFIITPHLTWDILLGTDFLARYECHIDVRNRRVEFRHTDVEGPAKPQIMDETAACAAIQAAVQIPPTSIDDILPTTDRADVETETLKRMLLGFHDVFAWDEYTLGRTSCIRHAIETGTAKPIWQPPRRIPAHLQKEVDTLLDSMLATGVIKPSRSPWASPVTLVPKKDGTIRFCIDYRRLNAATTRDSFPLPRIECTLDALAGSRWFSTLDLKSGYWQVEVEPADRQKTAFILPQGLYEFETMPFGLCNAAATFQRLMQVVLSHLYPRQCLIYLDDVIVFGKTITQHNDNLRAVLLALREAGLTLNPQKCQFLREKVNYLGHEVSPSGIKVSAEKAGAILTWPTPNSTTEVRSFIGLASYYRRFIRDFAGIARPLHRLTEKGREFRWTDECQAAFDELRTRLSRAPTLMLPNTTETAPPFVLDTDASAFAMGGVLSQTDDNGLERVICFASKTLTKPQRNYCTYRRELLAIVTFVKQFRPYLLGKPFVIRSDHKALQWLQNTKDAEGQLARWQEMLQEYHFTCTYRPGKQHGNADALSRRPTTPAAHDDDRPIGEINAIYASEPARHHWAIAQSTDPDTAVIYDHLLNHLHRPTDDELRGSSEEAYILLRQWPRLHIDEDILLIKDESTETNRVVVPGSLVQVVLTDLHNELGHVGQAKTEAATRQRFWWPHLREHVATFCNTCTTCAKFKAPRQLPRAPLQPMHTSFPFQRLGLDIIGPLPFTTTGHRFILVMVDYFTKWAEAVPLLRQDAVSLTNAIFNNWICRFGVPLSIHSDCGANFDSKLLQEVCDLLDIYKTRTTPAHPEGNGLVERTNRTLNQLLKAFAEDHHPHDWDKRLPCAMMAYRANTHTSTGYPPFLMLTGRQFRLPADSRFPQPAASEYAPDSYVWQLQDLLRSTYTLARNHLGAAAERQKTYFDRQVHGNPYQLGDLVWRFRPVPPLGTAAKFFHPWEGPFVVVDVIHPTTYVLRDASRPDGPTFTTHFDKLKPYRGRLPTATADVTPIIPPHLVPTPVAEETMDMTRPDSPADRAPSEEGGM
ncbi:hypothetical protein SprV_0100348100 [Sparganum proliferum]